MWDNYEQSHTKKQEEIRNSFLENVSIFKVELPFQGRGPANKKVNQYIT